MFKELNEEELKNLTDAEYGVYMTAKFANLKEETIIMKILIHTRKREKHL